MWKVFLFVVISRKMAWCECDCISDPTKGVTMAAMTRKEAHGPKSNANPERAARRSKGSVKSS